MRRAFAWRFLAAAAYVVVLAAASHGEAVFARIFPSVQRPLYTRATFLELALAHIELIAAGTLIAAAAGIGVAIFVTRSSGRQFLALAGALAAIGQTFPPVAVLALSVPLLGYGEVPTIAALALYAVLPILEATVAGIHAVPAAARQAADGLGFSPAQRLLRVELPLAAPFVMTGLRTAAIINIGTATIGSSVGALSLGSPIIEGLSASNPAYVIEGALAAAGMAIVCDLLLEGVQDWLAARYRDGGSLPQNE